MLWQPETPSNKQLNRLRITEVRSGRCVHLQHKWRYSLPADLFLEKYVRIRKQQIGSQQRRGIKKQPRWAKSLKPTLPGLQMLPLPLPHLFHFICAAFTPASSLRPMVPLVSFDEPENRCVDSTSRHFQVESTHPQVRDRTLSVLTSLSSTSRPSPEGAHTSPTMTFLKPWGAK